jgi:hypothetical protein
MVDPPVEEQLLDNCGFFLVVLSGVFEPNDQTRLFGTLRDEYLGAKEPRTGYSNSSSSSDLVLLVGKTHGSKLTF